MPSNEIYLINGIKGLRKIRKPFLILWIDIKNKSEPLTCYDDLVRIIMIWCGRQELNLHGVSHKILRNFENKKSPYFSYLPYTTTQILSKT